MWDRLLCAIDQSESGERALGFVAGVASSNQASVRVLHIRELSKMARALPLETPFEAEELVRDGVMNLGMMGVAAERRSCSTLEDHVAKQIVQEARRWDCQAIVLGSRRLRGIGRLSGRGVRGRILRASCLPVLVGPGPRPMESIGRHGSGPSVSNPTPTVGRQPFMGSLPDLIAASERQ